ncbi:hypothetical protein [Sinorhizobium saheli]|uniref:hypothetical protein n=1 Tax=Sinorhizobium saheli TaxID=36856 RepID=UPI001294ED6C|nr:hypothetical protein [Sinorhizobium saheli]MQW89999.1 hypothetical protein [Sinorhizobium saheli]
MHFSNMRNIKVNGSPLLFGKEARRLAAFAGRHAAISTPDNRPVGTERENSTFESESCSNLPTVASGEFRHAKVELAGSFSEMLSEVSPR